MLLFDFFSFFVFLFLISMIFFCLLLWQVILRWLPSFSKESTLQYLKKIQVRIIIFDKEAVVKTSRISNSKSLPWTLAKFRSDCFEVNASRIVCWRFLFLIVNYAHLHSYTICLRPDMYSSTEIQYLQNEPSEKGTHTKESMMLKMFYLYGTVRWRKCIWWAM